MGTSLGCVKFSDGTIFYAKYQNTSDIMNYCLWVSQEDVFNRYCDGKKAGFMQMKPDCQCGNEEPVFLATNYGGGFYWSGRACKRCMVITDGFSPFEVWGFDRIIIPAPRVYFDGLPDWWPGLLV